MNIDLNKIYSQVIDELNPNDTRYFNIEKIYLKQDRDTLLEYKDAPNAKETLNMIKSKETLLLILKHILDD